MLTVDGVSRQFRKLGGATHKALDEVSLEVNDGEAVGLVGESGSGKTTLLRCVMRLDKPDSGCVRLDGRDIRDMRRKDLAVYRQRVQMIFQDPRGSLNPRQTVEDLIGEGLAIHHLVKTASERRWRVVELMELVGLDSRDLKRHIGSFSGGQQQRVAIARALAVKSDILVCDEPTSALDVSVQAQILNLLKTLQDRLGLSILFVSHDLAVVRYLCKRVYVLHNGRVVETGSTDQIFSAPKDEYTQELLEALPGG
ncbi:MAG: ABC transporter ATP-binding protein [Microbacteriaceae bacterium]|nr:MAG: ABC transporter ATP-binding protein [Microbacteriaceae bacterium]